MPSTATIFVLESVPQFTFEFPASPLNLELRQREMGHLNVCFSKAAVLLIFLLWEFCS